MDSRAWHYPRTELTNRVFRYFEETGGRKITFFAERRKGKTEFLKLDLQPQAERRNYVPVYVNFWEQKDRPDLAFLVAITRALSEEAGIIKKGLKSLKLTGAGLGLELEFQRASVGDAQVLSELTARFDELVELKKPILLMLDEVQHLATSPSFENFTSWLRTKLDGHDGGIFTVFTGSSRDGLTRLFRRQKAPFYHASDIWPFEPLENAFVEHVIALYRERSGKSRAIPIDRAVAVFERFNRTPEHFVGIVRRMLDSGREDIDSVADEYEEELDEPGTFEAIFMELKPLDRSLLIRLTEAKPGDPGIYTAEGKEKLAEKMGLESISTSSIQNAVERLRSAGLIYQAEHGAWELEDPAFADWVAAFGNLSPGH